MPITWCHFKLIPFSNDYLWRRRGCTPQVRKERTLSWVLPFPPLSWTIQLQPWITSSFHIYPPWPTKARPCSGCWEFSHRQHRPLPSGHVHCVPLSKYSPTVISSWKAACWLLWGHRFLSGLRIHPQLFFQENVVQLNHIKMKSMNYETLFISLCFWYLVNLIDECLRQLPS